MNEYRILRVCEADFGGGSPDAIFTMTNGIVSSVYYEGESENLAWSQHEGWADRVIGFNLPDVQRWAVNFFNGFQDDHRRPWVAIITPQTAVCDVVVNSRRTAPLSARTTPRVR